MSEKLDGVRAYWNGVSLVSKDGKKLTYPDRFIEGFPEHTSIDGELWIQQGNWELVLELLNSNNNDMLLWNQISYMIFDLPNSNEPYEIRIRDIANMNLPKHVHVLDVERCKGNHHLFSLFGHILEIGGEGLMMNKPMSLYVSVRTDSLLKVKVSGSFFYLYVKICLMD
jgi:DNA ligase-1